MTTQIIVVKPKTLNAADKKALREVGVVCIEAADPESVRFLQPDSQPMSSNDLFFAAISAIAKSDYTDTPVRFARNVQNILDENRKKETRE